MSPETHIPVLVTEVLQLLAPQAGDTLLDATVGHGGHARAYLEATPPTGRVIGLDADPAAIEVAAANLAEFGDRVELKQMNFSQLKDSADGGGILLPGFNHVLFDLGIGSHQLADSARGFSFESDQSLSMRYGSGSLPPAQFDSLNVLEQRIGHYPDVPELLAQLRPEELADIIYGYGEERLSRRIAAAISTSPLPATSVQLAERIAAAVPRAYAHGRLHPATRTFQALRLAVNRELEALRAVLPLAVELLEVQGKIAILSFHSLEDRIVKYFFREHANLKILTKHPVRGSREEVTQNPRARSAKLRVAQKQEGSK